MKSKFIHWLAIVLILEIGIIHLLNAQSEYDEATYMGYLFMANFGGAVLAALGLYWKKTWGWGLGLAISGGSVAGYAWSRTLGMPGMEIEDWFNPYGIVAMSLEAIFAGLCLLRPWKDADPAPALLTGRSSLLASLAGLVVIASLSFFAYRWDSSTTPVYGYHVGTLEQVRSLPETTSAQLEADYGIQVSLVAVSMLDSIVDVRVRIIDPDKAHAILQNQAALLVGQQVLILAPHMHSHNTTRLKAGKVFTLFFPTQQVVAAGTDVNLVFGPIRIERAVVQ
jgi:hypothetical protein